MIGSNGPGSSPQGRKASRGRLWPANDGRLGSGPMGDMVSFASNGDARGLSRAAASGTGPGVMVVQEWWGLVPNIKQTCDRFATEGFVALMPDLYHGDLAEHTEMDKAAQPRRCRWIAPRATGRGRLTRAVLVVQGDRIRRRRLLHGRDADPRRRRAAGRQDRRGRALLPRATGRERSRLVRPHGAGAGILRLRRRLTSRPPPSRRSRPS